MAHEGGRDIGTLLGAVLHPCRNFLEQENTSRFKARSTPVPKHTHHSRYTAYAAIARGKIQWQQSECRGSQKFAGLVYIGSILLGHQPGNIGRALFQHANERFGQALDVLLAAVRTRKRPFYLSVHFAHVAEILVDRTEECLVDVVPFLHECFFLSGFGCLV